MLVKLEAHDIAIEADPGIHLPPADIAYHVVDMQKARRPCNGVVALGAESRQEYASIIFALNERV